MITVVGIGPGDTQYLTPRAQQAISLAEVLVGGKRHLATFGGHGRETRLLDADLLGLLEWLDSQKSRDIVVHRVACGIVLSRDGSAADLAEFMRCRGGRAVCRLSERAEL